MENIANYHHIIPRFYLRGFTPTGNKADKLWVLNFKEKRSRPANTRSVGGQEGFYAVDTPGKPTDALEHDINREFEDPAAPIIKEIITNCALPEGEDFAKLISFIALMYVRVEAVRLAAAEGDALLLKQHARLYAINAPERVPAYIKALRQEGAEFPDQISADNLRTLEFDEYKVTLTQKWHIKNFLANFGNFDELVSIFARRRWTLHVSEESNVDFICSDHPVVLTWTLPVSRFDQWHPGLAHTHTELTLPLNRRMALVGRFADCKGLMLCNDQPAMPADKLVVAVINRRTLDRAWNEVYSVKKDFVWMKNDHSICEIADPNMIVKEQRINEFGGIAF
jgi:Protein of unknown function (DUF4238)